MVRGVFVASPWTHAVSDACGLCSELFQQFFEALFKDGCSLFACSTAAATKPLYLPNADLLVDGRLDEGVAYQYEGIGRMLVKRYVAAMLWLAAPTPHGGGHVLCCGFPRASIFDGHPIPVAFAPSLYKFLLGLPVNMHDLEAFDRDTYDECVATLQTAPDELDMLGQDFEQVGEAPRDVTGDNRREFVSKLISYTLVKSRKVPCCPTLPPCVCLCLYRVQEVTLTRPLCLHRAATTCRHEEGVRLPRHCSPSAAVHLHRAHGAGRRPANGGRGGGGRSHGVRALPGWQLHPEPVPPPRAIAQQRRVPETPGVRHSTVRAAGCGDQYCHPVRGGRSRGLRFDSVALC